MIVQDLSAFSVEHYFETRLNRFSGSFIKMGIRVGRADLESFYDPNPMRFWSENKASGYDAHYFGISTLGVGRTTSIRLPDGATNDWDVWFDNVANHDVSGNNFTGPARYMWTGTRIQDGAEDTRTYGSTSSLYFYNLGGNITPRWQGASDSAYISLTPGDNYSYWADTYWWARMGRNQC